MTQQINKPGSTKWFIAYTGGEPYAYGEVNIENEMTTGHETLECFNTEEEYLVRIEELGITIENIN